jgi:vacuolar-type H+-ATPase subunit I/STV1
MQKILGYVLMVLGLLIISFNLIFENIAESLEFLSFLIEANIIIIAIIGLGLIIAGYYLSQQQIEGSKKQQKEVPIYKGEGKKRKIVGYRQMR